MNQMCAQTEIHLISTYDHDLSKDYPVDSRVIKHTFRAACRNHAELILKRIMFLRRTIKELDPMCVVSLGACVVMITGQLIFCQYYPLGASPDPARLAAQVIAGVGFLGAGTILREGSSIKGLTTAASVWTVACLGVAVGAGFYVVGLVGVVLMMITLVTFERLQKRFLNGREVVYAFTVTVRDVSAVMDYINGLAKRADAVLMFIRMDAREEGMELQFTIQFGRRHYQSRAHDFFAALGQNNEVISIKTENGV